MKRRTFILASSSATLSGATLSGVQKPSFALNFELKEVPDEDPTNVETVTIDFPRFELTPKYTDDSKKATININVSIEGKSTNISKSIPITNGETVKTEDLGSSIPITIDNISTTEELIEGTVEITVEHDSVGEETYSQSFNITPPDYIKATGGTTQDITGADGENYRVHAFKSIGTETFEITNAPPARGIDVLIVGGGGGGGSDGGGGGGAGGLIYKEGYSVTESTYNVYVGDSGSGDGVPDDGVNADNGEDSKFGDLTALGGGGGASWNSGNGNDGSDGGSGGGAAGSDVSLTGGSATQPGSTDGGFGNDGGDSTAHGGGGGGGAGESGENSSGSNNGENGGDGKYYGDVFTESYGDNGYFAGGGAGGDQTGSAEGGDGGLGGGADSTGESTAPSGTPNTGGGGAGSSGNGNFDGGKGGSGIVLIRYKIE